MKVLLYEHVSSGGYAGDPFPPSLLSEGFGMLRCLASDFTAAGHSVTVLLDARLAALSPPIAVDHVVQVASSGEADQSMEKTAESADAVFVVAPESNHILQQMVECIETTGAHSLNGRPEAIEQAADKAELSERITNLRFNYPKTFVFGISEPVENIKRKVKSEFGFPFVLKPSSGAGCSGMSLVQNEDQIAQAIEKIKKETVGDIIAQEYIQGVPASVSLISTGPQALPVSLNLQDITLAQPEGASSYNGGLVPFEHPRGGEAFTAAKRVVESFGELRGYVGVDMVLTDEKAYVVEVNPRLTTSYVGLRRVADFNVAEAIADAILKNALPQGAHTAGVACFSKVPVSRPVIFAWQEFCTMDELVSPPFPIANEESSYALLQSYGETTEDALLCLREGKEHLHEVWLRGQHPW
jgi:tyramine---L-glutamate ligase